MENRINDTALMVFSLSPRKEAIRKAVFGRKRKEATHSFFDLLIKQTSGIAFSSGLDVVWIDEKKQRGTSFGERYANAFEDVFNQGYEKVISIGNDCPELTLGILKRAVDQLKDNTLVLGPASDGGIYLLGLNRNFFNAPEFIALPWLGKTLFTELTFNAAGKGFECVCLETLSDTDTIRDIMELAWRNPESLLSNFILQYVSKQLETFNTISYTIISCFNRESFSLRGPPAFS